MTFLSDFIANVKDWIDDLDPSDPLVTSWVRDAEERMNNELRVNEMITRDYATFDDNCAALPSNWLESIYVKIKGGLPYHYITNDAYWQVEQTGDASFVTIDPGEIATTTTKMFYTYVGNTLFVWPPVNAEALTQIEVGYYKKITPLDTVKDAVLDRFPSIYRNCTLAAGAPYLIEDERLSTFAALATAGIAKANDQAKAARYSGSPLLPRVRGFG